MQKGDIVKYKSTGYWVILDVHKGKATIALYTDDKQQKRVSIAKLKKA